MKSLRITAILEGVSYLLFGLSMPLKYFYHILLPNKIIGMAHGILFILYILIAFLYRKNWNLKTQFTIYIASLIPFGTFYVEKKYFRNDE